MQPLKNHLPVFTLLTGLILETVFVYLGVPAPNFPLFLLIFFLGSYLPGMLLFYSLKIECRPIERLTIEIAGGYTLTTLLLFVCRLLKLENIYFLAIILMVLLSCFLLYQGKISIPRLKLKKDRFSFLFIGTFILIIAYSGFLTFPGWLEANKPFLEPGSLQLTSVMSRDDIFHHGLINELSHTMPPNYHYAGNLKSLYHFFADLYASFYVRYLDFKPADLTMRFQPVLHFTLWFLAIYVLARKLFGNRNTALFTVFFISFTGNLGFISKLLGTAPLLFSEYQFLPIIWPMHVYSFWFSFPLLFLGLFSFLSYEENGQAGWFILGVYFFVILSGYKVFTLLHVFMGLVVPALILLIRGRKRYFSYLLVILGVTGLLWGLAIRYYSPFDSEFLAFNPWYLVYNAFFRKTSVPYNAFYQSMFQSGYGGFLKNFVGMGVLFYLGSLGTRLFGLKAWLKDLLDVSVSPTRCLIAYLILAGIIFSSVFTIPPDHYNVANFMMLASILLSFYAAAAIVNLLTHKSVPVKLIVLTSVALSLITTAEMALKRQTEYIPASLIRIAAFFDAQAAPGAIIAHPMEAPFYYVFPALSKVRTLIEDTFPAGALIGENNWKRLVAVNKKLYQTTDPRTVKKIITSYNIDFVMEDGRNQLKAPKQNILQVVYNRDGFIINQVIK